MDIHRLIRRRFKTYSQDNLPHTSIRRSRTDLAKLYQEVGFTRGVEIGVCTGKHSQILCEHIPGVELYCVDPWLPGPRTSAERQEAFHEAARVRLQPYNVTIMRMPSMAALPSFEDGSLDFVHVDGDHTFDHAAADIIFWSRKLKVGGIMSVHDYCPFRWGGVVEAVDAYTTCHHVDPWYVIREMQPTAFWVQT